MKKLAIVLLLTSALFGSSGRNPFVLGCIDIQNGEQTTKLALAVYGFVDGVVMSYYVNQRGGEGTYHSTTDKEVVEAMIQAQEKYKIKEDFITEYFAKEIIMLMHRKFRVY